VFDHLVANASPLIFLSRVGGYAWLLNLSSGHIHVPQAVIGEIDAGADGGEVLGQIESHDRFTAVADCEVPRVVAAWDLGAGETQVLSHCSQFPKAVAVLDDRLARQCAQSLGIRVIGTLGVVLAAKRRGFVPAARPVVDQLVAKGLYLAPDLIAAALREVGE